jgi:hypothetical protein
MEITQGDIVLVTSGEYSDFGIVAFTEALQDFDGQEVVDKFLVEKRRENSDYYFLDAEFGDWLINQGYLKKKEFKEMFLDKYNIEVSITKE